MELTTTSALQDLRDATATHHMSVEKCMPLFNPGFSLKEYSALLGKFYGFHKPLEDKLAPWSAGIPELQWDLRQRTAALSQDLRALGLEDLTSLALSSQLPACHSVPQALGVLYVLEGSTLGGQVITKHLKEKGFPAEGLAYFGGYGEKTGVMWKQFQKVLNALVESPADRQAAITAAQDTFTCLEKWLRKEN